MLKVADATEFSKPLVIGFFHPYCNAGGGGERVLWAAIRTTLQTQPNAFCLVYTGDTDVSKNDIIERALVCTREQFTESTILLTPCVECLRY